MSTYHICYETENIDETLLLLRKYGYMPISKKTQSIFDGRMVIFLFIKQLYNRINTEITMDVKEKVFEIIAGVCEVSTSEVTLDSTIGDFPAWDSMGHLTILSSVEEAFEINFEPEEMMELEAASDIVKAVEEKL